MNKRERKRESIREEGERERVREFMYPYGCGVVLDISDLQPLYC